LCPFPLLCLNFGYRTYLCMYATANPKVWIKNYPTEILIYVPTYTFHLFTFI
jgi:hypothetical protein